MTASGVRDLVEAFVMDDKKFDVNIQMENGKPMFKAIDVGDVLGLTNIKMTIAKYDADERIQKTIRVNLGVNNPYGDSGRETWREATFLTEAGLYRLLMQSRKPAARPFQKWIVNVLENIRKTGGYHIDPAVREELEQRAIDAEKRVELLQQEGARTRAAAHEAAEIARHHTILDMVATSANCVVYIGRIRTEEDGRMLIKIGSTKDLNQRCVGLPKEFGDMRILDVFDVVAYRQFEDFLQEYTFMAERRFRGVIHEGHTSHREVLLLEEHELGTVISIAQRHAPQFSDSATVEQMIRLEKLKIEVAALEDEEDDENMIRKKQIADDIERLTVSMLDDPRNHTASRGPKVQRYSPGGQLLQTYEGYTEATRDPLLPVPTSGGMKKAAKHRVLYKGFRWATLNRSLPDNTVQHIGDTAESGTMTIGLVAMLDLKLSHIVNVFPDMQTAAKNRKFKAVGAISNAIKRGSVSSGHYFKMWHNCPEAMRESWQLTNTLPVRYRQGSTRLVRINPLTNDKKEVGSVSEAMRQLKVSRKKLLQSVRIGCILRGYRWELQATEGSSVPVDGQFSDST